MSPQGAGQERDLETANGPTYAARRFHVGRAVPQR